MVSTNEQMLPAWKACWNSSIAVSSRQCAAPNKRKLNHSKTIPTKLETDIDYRASRNTLDHQVLYLSIWDMQKYLRFNLFIYRYSGKSTVFEISATDNVLINIVSSIVTRVDRRLIEVLMQQIWFLKIEGYSHGIYRVIRYWLNLNWKI